MVYAPDPRRCLYPRYVATAIEWREAGTAVLFATISQEDGALIGSTRFRNLEHWAWPPNHRDAGRPFDACEIGYTWLTRSAIARLGGRFEGVLRAARHAKRNRPVTSPRQAGSYVHAPR